MKFLGVLSKKNREGGGQNKVMQMSFQSEKKNLKIGTWWFRTVAFSSHNKIEQREESKKLCDTIKKNVPNKSWKSNKNNKKKEWRMKKNNRKIAISGEG